MSIFKTTFPSMGEKSTAELIEEIHETFYTEHERLLAEANIRTSSNPVDEVLANRADRLATLGFVQSKEVQKAQEQRTVSQEEEGRNKEKERLVRAIEYFSQKYPFYKFITHESVIKICEKYNLFFGEVSDFVGTVPEKNLQEIEKFKIEEADRVYMKRFSSWPAWSSREASWEAISHKEWVGIVHPPRPRNKGDVNWLSETMYRGMGLQESTYQTGIKPLMIAAPLKDFKIDDSKMVAGREIKKVDIPDPVVMQPVWFEGRCHYLIVTAWGEEASDELVVNDKFN